MNINESNKYQQIEKYRREIQMGGYGEPVDASKDNK